MPRTTKSKISAKNIEELKSMDVVFIIDVTGSMTPYLQEAKQKAAEILREIRETAGLDIRVGLIVYRDHPPQDYSFVTQVNDFDTIEHLDGWLDPLFASGGGDHPEAVWDGVNKLFTLSWREVSDRVVYLIGDAPPHEPCTCGLTRKKIISDLKEFGIEVNAHSIAGERETTEQFGALVEATGGTISTGARPHHGTEMYYGSMLAHSVAANNSVNFVQAYATTTGTYTGASDVDMTTAYTAGEAVGLNADEVERTVAYLKRRKL